MVNYNIPAAASKENIKTPPSFDNLKLGSDALAKKAEGNTVATARAEAFASNISRLQGLLDKLPKVKASQEAAPAQVAAGEVGVFDINARAAKLAAAERRSAEKKQPSL